MVFLEFHNNHKLAIIERDEKFLDQTCAGGRKEIISEIGEMLPSTFRFVLWGNPLSSKQESIYTLRKCAIQIQDDKYPTSTEIFRVRICALACEDSGSAGVNLKLQASAPASSTSSTSFQTSNIGEKAIDRLLENLSEQRQSLEFRLQLAQATISSLKEKPKERATIGRNPTFTCSNCHFKGHRVTGCHQPPCQGYFECGNTLLHKEHREEVRKVSCSRAYKLGYQ